MLIFCDFILVYVLTTNHHLNIKCTHPPISITFIFLGIDFVEIPLICCSRARDGTAMCTASELHSA